MPSAGVISKGSSMRSRPGLSSTLPVASWTCDRSIAVERVWIEFSAAWRAAWEEIHISIQRMTDINDRVLTLGNFHLRGGASGVEVRAEAAFLHTVKHGRIVHIRAFSTWNQALEAVGLRE